MFDILDYSFENPAENLALEECLLKPMLKAARPRPLLRIWENTHDCIVLGRAEKAEHQIHLEQLKHKNIPVLRRTSGGGTVLHGAGNINLSFFLPYDYHDGLKNIRHSYEIILNWVTQALHTSCGVSTHMKGSSDLSIGDKKISGTAQARKRHGLLHHMTLLVDFDLSKIHSLLKEPEKRPDYRGERSHHQFVTTLKNEGYTLTKSMLWEQFIHSLPAEPMCLPEEMIREAQCLAKQKYQQDSWNFDGLEPSLMV
jgi:lipoate---protein ligase